MTFEFYMVGVAWSTHFFYMYSHYHKLMLHSSRTVKYRPPPTPLLLRISFATQVPVIKGRYKSEYKWDQIPRKNEAGLQSLGAVNSFCISHETPYQNGGVGFNRIGTPYLLDFEYGYWARQFIGSANDFGAQE